MAPGRPVIVYPPKDPDAVLDYAVDWSEWLAEGETITAATWDVPPGLTIVSEVASPTTPVIWLRGGTVGQSYDLVNHVVTSQGREDDRTVRVRVRER